jgi:lipid-binding SYLF domain-containing protein
MITRFQTYTLGVRNIVLILILGLMLTLLGNPAWAMSEEQQIVDKSVMSLINLHKASEWFRDHGKEAKALYIVPSLFRGAFIFGGAGGSGVLIVKQPDGSWSQPAFYTMGSASFGLQIGADTSEIVLVVRTQRGLESFYTHDFRLGGDMSVALGPMGAGTRGGGITGDFVSFAKSKGVYGGLSVDGQGVAVADTANMEYYGKSVRPTDILVKQSVSNPGSKKLRETATNLLK